MATDKGNSWNETWHWTNDEIGVAVQSWFWVQVVFMAWKLSWLERLNRIQWLWVQIPLRPTFYGYFKESFSGEYHLYIYIYIYIYVYTLVNHEMGTLWDIHGRCRNMSKPWMNEILQAYILNMYYIKSSLLLLLLEIYSNKLDLVVYISHKLMEYLHRSKDN